MAPGRAPRQGRVCLEYLGHTVDGGFYYIDMGGVEMTVPANLAMVTVAKDQDTPLAVELTEDLIRDEFRQVLPGFEGQVRRISPTEFAVAFPSVELLRMCACCDVITLPINKIKVSIRPSTAHTEMPYSLSTM